MSEEEKKPLLNSGGGPGDATPTAPPMEPPPYEEPSVPAPYLPPSSGASYPPAPSSNAVPPPYSSTQTPDPGQSLFVQCRVCQHVIHVAPGTQSRVVKCSNCMEATPIAPPPPGKKYVRCPCNCLLTCSETASRVICPRENCKRTIGVGTIDVQSIERREQQVRFYQKRRVPVRPSARVVAVRRVSGPGSTAQQTSYAIEQPGCPTRQVTRTIIVRQASGRPNDPILLPSYDQAMTGADHSVKVEEGPSLPYPPPSHVMNSQAPSAPPAAKLPYPPPPLPHHNPHLPHPKR